MIQELLHWLIELPVNNREHTVSGTARYLASRGPGIHHVCLYSEDFDYDMQRLRDAGLREIGTPTPGRPGEASVGWFHPRSNMGVLVEVWHDVPAT